MDRSVKEKAKILREKILTDIYDNHLIEFVRCKGKYSKYRGRITACG